jgi:hypothetical protein
MTSAARLQTRNVALQGLFDPHPIEQNPGVLCSATLPGWNRSRAHKCLRGQQVLKIVAARRSGKKSKTALESLRWLACHGIELWSWRATAREVLKNWGSDAKDLPGCDRRKGIGENR